MQFQADVLGCPVERPDLVETTALGAAGLAGLALGLWRSTDEFLAGRRFSRFEPRSDARWRKAQLDGWHRAVGAALGWAQGSGTTVYPHPIKYFEPLPPEPDMKAGRKFIVGAALIVGSVGFLITEGVKETGVYFLTPTELAAKTAADPTFSTTSDSSWAPRWCRLGPPRPQRATESTSGYPTASRPIRSPTMAWCPTPSPMPATSKSSSRAGWEARVIRATDVLAKCGSRYEAVPKA